MKETGGALTGDKSMKRGGRSDQRKRKATEKKGAAKDLLSQHRFGQRSRRVEVLRISALALAQRPLYASPTALEGQGNDSIGVLVKA